MLDIETELHINELLDRALNLTAGQVLLSASRCVDALLDLFGASSDQAIRGLCGDALRRIGRVGVVRADEFRADLTAIAAAVAAVGAGDLTSLGQVPSLAGG
jgi:hypothetical protein